MAFNDVLVHVDNARHTRERLRLAAQLVRDAGGHVAALHVRPLLHLPPFVAAQIGPEVEELRGRAVLAAAREARASFEAVVPDLGITTEWREAEGNAADIITRHARYADVTVIGQAESAEDGPPLVDALVLDVGRPVLVVPYAGSFPSLGRRVVVAWNGSREATRAVHDALPLLCAADQVTVIVVNPGNGHGDIPGADVTRHLSRHGVTATCETMQADDLEVGQVLLSRAADLGADLLVMGAYGRSRLRELVLGGATRHILRHMTLPVFLSH